MRLFYLFRPHTLLFIKQPPPILPLFNFPFDTRSSHSWLFLFWNNLSSLLLPLLREDILSLHIFCRRSSCTFLNQIHAILVMYQSFTGISDSLWIYWAHSLVCDWQRKRCENHLHNWIHGAFNTTFDNKQWFLTLSMGERCQNLGVHFGHSEGSWAFCSSPVFVSGIICIWWTSVLQSHWWVSLNHMFNWLWSWGYLGIHWNVFYGLLLLLLKSPTAGSVQLMLHAERHSRSQPRVNCSVSA